MAIESYFFNAKLTEGKYDRVYTSKDITTYLDKIVGSGVFPTPSNCLQVYAGSGLRVYVRPGQGWINGHKIINTADYPLTIEAVDVTLNRIDRVVFRVNNLTRQMEIVVKKGTNASEPVPPDIVRNDDLVEYSLATITINKRAEAITDAMIRDTRLDSTVCGVVQGLIQQVGTDTLYKQWADAFDRQYAESWDEFNEWFGKIKDTLSTSTLIREFCSTHVTSGTDTETITIDIPQYVVETDILNVYVNGLRLTGEEFTNTDTQITFTPPLHVAGTEVEIVVQKSVDGSDAVTVVEQVEALQKGLSDLKNNVKNPKLLFDGAHAAEQLSVFRYLTVENMSDYDIIKVRLQLGTLGENIIDFHKGMAADSGRINQTVSCFKDVNTYACASLRYDITTNQLGWRADSAKGLTVDAIQILKVWGIKF